MLSETSLQDMKRTWDIWLKQNEYDAQRRYLDIAASLESEDVQFVTAATGSIESREAALQGLQELGGTTGSTKCLVVYVPTERPETDEQKQQDPFSIYALCCSVFPRLMAVFFAYRFIGKADRFLRDTFTPS